LSIEEGEGRIGSKDAEDGPVAGKRTRKTSTTGVSGEGPTE